jgi:hypothetical protein
MIRVRAALDALRSFARGFLGFATPMPSDPAAARKQIQQSAESRPRCC